MRIHYPRRSYGPTLLDALRDAGIPAVYVETNATDTWVTVPDGIDRAQVDAIVAAHDPTQPSRAAQQARAARETLAAFLALDDAAWAALSAEAQRRQLRAVLRVLAAAWLRPMDATAL